MASQCNAISTGITKHMTLFSPFPVLSGAELPSSKTAPALPAPIQKGAICFPASP